MKKIEVDQISGVPETMLIPLWAKAVETGKDGAIIRDAKSVEIVNSIDYDFSKFEKSWASQTGVSVRTLILDTAVREFLGKNGDAVIINLGAGLDTRFERLNDARISMWYDVDLPDVIDLRKRFFSESPRNHFIPCSIFNGEWMAGIRDRPVLIIAEGLLMYFAESDLRPFFDMISEEFRGGEMLFEMLAPLLVGRSRRHDSVKMTGGAVEFKWGPGNSRELETWNDHIRFMGEWNYFDFHKERWRYLRWLALIPAFRNGFNNRIVHLSFV